MFIFYEQVRQVGYSLIPYLLDWEVWILFAYLVA